MAVFSSSRDAMVGGDNFLVQIGVSTAGRFVCKKPLNLVHEKSRQLVSFSNYFAFSMSGVDGDGLAFVMLPSQFPLNVFDDGEMGFLKERKMKFLAVEFDTFKNEKHGDVNGNHVGIDAGSPVSVKVSNVSSFNLVLNGGEKLQAWIDYEASSKRFEVRLNKFGLSRLLTYSIDLSKMWGSENVVVGFSSSSANSSQRNSIHSWSFESRIMPRWMHSEPLDPQQSVGKEEERKVHTRSDCTVRIISGWRLAPDVELWGRSSC
ncbi:L-type lectin-domain containing receptor kinase VIII.2-like [Salvia splendens]|uniref:L-type lectin-domain containing receptor kinase VIII.2-like n=1 Tax=Salvia splendens TaxID=180675 RepID=UPI001C262242|nr:L-type lectin-domain containing receptor kinase VIII.2-like [Salvia splendens]